MPQESNITLADVTHIQADYFKEYQEIADENYNFKMRDCRDKQNQSRRLLVMEIGTWTSQKNRIGLWAHVEEQSSHVHFYKGKANAVLEWKGDIEDSPQQALYRDPFREVALKNNTKADKIKLIGVLVLFLYLVKAEIAFISARHSGEEVLPLLERMFRNIRVNREETKKLEESRLTRSRFLRSRRRNREVEDDERIDANANDSLRRVRLRLDNCSEDVKSCLSSLENQLAAKKQEHNAAESLASGLQDRLTEKEQEYEAAKSRHEMELTQKDEEYAAAIRAHEDRLAEQEGKTHAAEVKAAQSEEAKQVAEEAKSTAEKATQAAEEAKLAVENAMQAAEAAASKERGEFQDLQAQATLRINDLEKAKKKAINDAAVAEKELEKQKKAREGASIAKQELEQRTASLQSELDRNERQLVIAESGLKDRTGEFETLQSQYDEKVEEIKRKERELEAAREEVKVATNTLGVRQRALQATQQKLDSSKTEYEELQKRHGKLPQEIKRLYGLHRC